MLVRLLRIVELRTLSHNGWHLLAFSRITLRKAAEATGIVKVKCQYPGTTATTTTTKVAASTMATTIVNSNEHNSGSSRRQHGGQHVAGIEGASEAVHV